MAAVIGEILGLAVGIAISPIPIAAVILMLFSRRSRANGVSFLVGWVAGIAAVTVVVAVLPGLGAGDGNPSDATGWVKLSLGVVLLVVAAARWRGRPRPDEEVPVPRWMDRIDGLTPLPALGLGVLLSALNPKNLVLAAAAGATIGAAQLPGGQLAVVVAVFTALAAATVLVPVVAYLVAGDRLDESLERTKTWLVANNAAVIAVLLLVFGLNLVGNGLSILTA